MGVVYRAHDDRLGRDVAIKVLAQSLSRDAERLRRFEQEARAAAALNHPGILAIHDIGMQDGSPYIVTELLEGESLRQRLTAGPLPVRTVMDIGVQIARGFGAAHEKGIVHRDLKPENVFLTRDGRVKILDFGLAKLIRTEPIPAAHEGVTLTSDTLPGTVMGTLGYMAPEQLRGLAVDHRCDVFSFGAILYEMLSGKRAFRRETAADTMSAILSRDPPDLSETQRDIPPAMERIVRHCLEKNPEDRFQSARDLAFDLGSVLDVSVTKPAVQPAAAASLFRKYLPWGIAAVALISALLFLVSSRGTKEAGTPAYRRLTFQRGTVYSARFGSDQQTVIYGAAWGGSPVELFTTGPDAGASRPLNLSSASLLAVSRTGELALLLNGVVGAHLETIKATLARVPLAGGTPREVLENVQSADWDPKGLLAVVHGTNGRTRLEYPIGKVLYETSGWISNMRFSPDGERLAFLDHPALWDDRGSVAMVDRAGHVTTLSSGWQSEDGLAWSARGDEIWFAAVAGGGFNRALMAVDTSGRVRTVLRVPGGITLQDIAPDGRVLISFDDERLAMESVGANPEEARDLTWFDWTIAKDITPDHKSVLFEESSEPAGANYTVAMRKLDGSPPVRLGEGSVGGLSPDGKWALSVFTGSPQRITLLPVGAGEPREVSVPGMEHFENGGARFLPDGKRLLVNATEPGHAVRTYVQDIAGGKPRPLTPEGSIADLPSPDGRWVAGASHRRLTIYPVDGGEPRVISGVLPEFSPLQWGADGKSLYMYEDVELPAAVFRLELATGKRELVRKLMPKDPAGVVYISPVVMTRDASLFIYSYYRTLSVLYIVAGLR